MQNQAMQRLASAAPAVLVPHLRATTHSGLMVQVENDDGSKHFMRLLTYVPGRLLANVSPHTPELLSSLGHTLGSITKALVGFQHPARGGNANEVGWKLIGFEDSFHYVLRFGYYG